MKDNNTKMSTPVKIMVDWGGCIFRDSDLFSEICKNSGAGEKHFNGPLSWDNIRSIGNENFFDTIQDKFFDISTDYADAIDVVSCFCGSKGMSSKTETYVVYDNKPFLKINPDMAVAKMAKLFSEKRAKANGFYFDSDKLALSKRICATIAVDDDPRICIALASVGIKTILLLRKWNRFFSKKTFNLYVPEHKVNDIYKNITIAEDWIEVKQVVESIINSRRQ